MHFVNGLLAVLVGCLLLIGGCDSKPTHDSLTKETIDLMKDYVAVMKTVTDESSAKKAAPEILKMADKMNRINADMDKLGPPSEEIKAQLDTKYKKELEPLTMEMIGELMRLTMDPKLKKELDKVKEEDL